MTPEFAIITAIKDLNVDISKTLNSIKDQTFQDFEWIVICASADPSHYCLISHFLDSHRSVFISGVDYSLASAWNIGIRVSTAKYILILNAGDSYSPTFLEICRNYTDGKAIALGQPVIHSLGRGIPHLFRASPSKLWRGMHLAHNWMCVPRIAYLPDNLYSNYQYAMDYDWSVRTILLRKYPFLVIDPGTTGHGMYARGGLSDLNYHKSLTMSLYVSIKNSTMNKFCAPLIYLLYLSRRVLALFQ